VRIILAFFYHVVFDVSADVSVVSQNVAADQPYTAPILYDHMKPSLPGVSVYPLLLVARQSLGGIHGKRLEVFASCDHLQGVADPDLGLPAPSLGAEQQVGAQEKRLEAQPLVFIHLPVAELHAAAAEGWEEIPEPKPRPGGGPPRLHNLDRNQSAAGKKIPQHNKLQRR
jgi:hypothetical protein